VLCVVRARGLRHWQQDVLVVSIERLKPAVELAAGAMRRPSRLREVHAHAGRASAPPATTSGLILVADALAVASSEAAAVATSVA
jgi:hypothetical protein